MSEIGGARARSLVGKSKDEVEIPCTTTQNCPRVSVVVNKVTAPDANKPSVEAAIARSIQQAIAEFLAGRSGGGVQGGFPVAA